MSRNDFEKVVLTSYPRSGNTLLRKYLEDITGVITGSDCDVKRKLNSDLVEMGMSGEGRVSSKVMNEIDKPISLGRQVPLPREIWSK